MLNYEAIAATMTISEMTTVYNNYAESKVKKLSSKKDSSRVARLLEDNSAKISEIKKLVSNDTAEVISKIPPKRQTKFPGPKGKFTGGRIYKKVSDNPRREGTHGWESFERISNGMTYEQYREAGGRTVDLQWDVDKGHVEVKDKEGCTVT